MYVTSTVPTSMGFYPNIADASEKAKMNGCPVVVDLLLNARLFAIVFESE